jgi:hypothetical protein
MFPSDTSKEENDLDLEKEVAGEYNTFCVYLYLLKARKGSTREVQRALGFSSPRLAAYHLEKLCELKLADKDAWGSYVAIPRKFGILRFLILVKKWLIPRQVFYAVFFFGMAGYFLYLSFRDPIFFAAFVVSLLSGLINIVESYTLYKSVPHVGV